jgi:hypothetical protein
MARAHHSRSIGGRAHHAEEGCARGILDHRELVPRLGSAHQRRLGAAEKERPRADPEQQARDAAAVALVGLATRDVAVRHRVLVVRALPIGEQVAHHDGPAVVAGEQGAELVDVGPEAPGPVGGQLGQPLLRLGAR